MQAPDVPLAHGGAATKVARYLALGTGLDKNVRRRIVHVYLTYIHENTLHLSYHDGFLERIKVGKGIGLTWGIQVDKIVHLHISKHVALDKSYIVRL